MMSLLEDFVVIGMMLAPFILPFAVLIVIAKIIKVEGIRL